MKNRERRRKKKKEGKKRFARTGFNFAINERLSRDSRFSMHPCAGTQKNFYPTMHPASEYVLRTLRRKTVISSSRQ